jgi:Uma2 family endonuclease
VKVFDSSTGFLLPDGSVGSPDAVVVAAYQANGANLGWLLIPDSRTVAVWPASGAPRRLLNPASLATEPVLAGLAIDLEELWVE